MRRFLAITLIILLTVVFAVAEGPQDAPLVEKWHPFNGAWMPDADPAQIGPENFRTLQNLRYNATSIEGVQGYSKVNTTVLDTYLKIRNGYQLQSDGYTQETYNLVQAENTGLTASQVLVNKTAIGSQGDFEATEVQTDGTGAGLGRFSDGPQGTVVYSNGVENKVWAGDEMRCAQIFRADIGASATGITGDYISFVDDGTDDYINSSSASFYSAGFRSGDTITVTGSTSNNGTYTVESVSWWFTKRLYLISTDSLTNEGAGATVTVKTSGADVVFTDIVNFTDKLNSSATTTYADIGGSDPSTFLVLSTRPLSGIKFYVGSANVTASTLAVKYWNGTTWAAVAGASDGTTAGGVAFAKTGTYSFTSTVSTAKMYHAEQTYCMYAYSVTLSAGSADIYRITVNAPWQDICNVWDGVDRSPIAFQVWDNSEQTYYDYTVEVNSDAQTTDYGVAELDGMTASDHIIIAFEEPMSAFRWQMFQDYINKNPSAVTVYYHDGEDYKTIGTIYNETVKDRFYGSNTFTQSGVTWWNPPTDETIRSEFNVTGYFYKIIVSATLTGTTGDDTPEVVVNHVWGVPAPQDVKKFKFASTFNNRVLLCNYEKAGQGNRVDYSVSNAPDVWNGTESSMDGVQSLYFGGNAPLTAGTQIYNRFGSNIFVTWVGLKPNETYLLTGTGPEDFEIKPISFNVGCPAPLTLATAEIGFDMAQDVTRNIVMWLSSEGPIVFDGAVINFIKGIEKYFDTTDSECINYAAIENSRGWFDPKYKEYNLLIPTGSSTTNNKWLVYSLIYKKWFEKVPSTYPQSAWQVCSTTGEKMIYGAIDTGYMLQLENGTAWNTGDIDQVAEPGDFFPSGSVWDQTRLRYFKFAAKAISEDANVSVSHYADTGETANPTAWDFSLNSGSGARILRDTIGSDDMAGWSHRFKFEVSTGDTDKGFQPLGYGYAFEKVRRDLYTPNDFIFTVTTAGADTFTLPLESTGSYNFTVNWGDDDSDTITAYDDAAVTHSYAAAGTYTVRIAGLIDGFRFFLNSDGTLLGDIKNWGPLRIGNHSSYFYDCDNLTVSATDILNLSEITDLSYMFCDAAIFNSDINNWDVSTVTSMLRMFYGAVSFDQDISDWDVSAVINMEDMFKNVTLSTSNYDALLISWSAKVPSGAYKFSGGNSTYTGGGAAAAARAAWVAKGWTITDGGIAP